MTTLTLNGNKVSTDDERTLLLGVEYDVADERHLEDEGDFGAERERYDEQIFAGLLGPW